MSYDYNDKNNPFETGNSSYRNSPFAQTGNPFGQTQNPYGTQGPEAFYEAGTRDSLSTYIAKTYLWMFAGLMITFLVALGMAASGLVYRMFMGGGSAVLIVCTIAELAVVIALSARIHKMSPSAAGAMFFIYAALTGVTFSLYFVLFDLTILTAAFGATALFFGGMAAVSLIFKMELDTIRPYLFGGLIFLLVFGLLSLIFGLEAFQIGVCYIGIAVFLGYTAYDTSKIRANYQFYAHDAALLKKASIFSALQLYLDFINLFLYILRILGRRSK